jgi:PEP-CTERM motif
VFSKASASLAIAFQFAVTESDGITATSLGYYNGWNPSGGLASNETVGLFSLSNLNANGSTTYNLLDSVTVDAGTVDLFSGGYRFKDLTSPIFLPPGDYGVVAFNVGTNGDPYGDDVGPVFGSGITPANDTYQGVSFPNYPLGGTGDSAFHAAASFLYEPGNAVPEPASIALAVLGSMGLMLRRRR